MNLEPKNDIQTPDVSVIIPTYNRISMLEEALVSVLSQDFTGKIEIIVVDDNSQDKTSEIVSRKYSQIHLISLKQNIGAYAARNRALLTAKGKYIAFLDSDDLWEKNYLTTQINALKNQETSFAVSSLVICNTAKNQKQTVTQKPNLEKYTSLFHHLLVQSFIHTPSSVVIPRKVFEQLGLFDETIRVGQDAALYERLILTGCTPIYTELPLAIKREHSSDQLTNARNLELRKKNRIARVNKLYPMIKQRFEIVPIQRLYAEIYADFAKQYFNQKYLFHWFRLSLESAHNSSLGYALLNMMSDVKDLLHRKLVRLPEIKNLMN